MNIKIYLNPVFIEIKEKIIFYFFKLEVPEKK